MPWYDVFAPLPALVEELRGIRLQLTRIADAQEGIAPPLRVVSEAEPDPAALAGASSDKDYARIESIEQRYLALSGRLPTEEEITRELDGGEIPDEVLREALERRQRIGAD